MRHFIFLYYGRVRYSPVITWVIKSKREGERCLKPPPVGPMTAPRTPREWKMTIAHKVPNDLLHCAATV